VSDDDDRGSVRHYMAGDLPTKEREKEREREREIVESRFVEEADRK